jgi:SAM-dependent methyltransferase
MKNWVDGIPYEIAFWEGVYYNKSRIKGISKWSKYNNEIELPHFDVKAFLMQKNNPTVVDAGSGMSYYHGDKLNGKQLNVIYIDPLAPFFNKIIDNNNVKTPKITFGFVEYLSAFLPSKVSLVIVQNALDHSKNPLRGILECVESLEIGGVLYLRHFVDEAETENYCGFHQHNIRCENGDLIIWNKETRMNINERIKSFSTIETNTYENEVIAVITKTSEVTPGIIDYKNDLAELSQHYIETLQNFNKISYVLSYHLKLFRYRIAQSIAQHFSWETRQKIKKLLKKLMFFR